MKELLRQPSLPRKAWIGSYEFPLRLVPPDDPVLATDAEPCEFDDGAMVAEESTRGIYIAANLDRRKLLEIFHHEITHAINWVNDIDDGVDEETIALKHGEAWSAFWLDNPRVQRWHTVTLNAIRRERSGA